MEYMTWQDFVYVSLQIIALVIAILSYLHRNDDRKIKKDNRPATNFAVIFFKLATGKQPSLVASPSIIL